jgi:hypothetical protein
MRAALVIFFLFAAAIAPAPAGADREKAGTSPVSAERNIVEAQNAEAASVRPSRVHASYRIDWLGAEIGDFDFHSTVAKGQYDLHATASVSVFLGAVSWKGSTMSHGVMTAEGPMPENYNFHWAAGEKHETVELRFTNRTVQDIVINPPQHPGGRRVPIMAAHLENVVDPLSAVILISQAHLDHHDGNACNRRLPIFDGKLRYDIVLAPKGTRSIGNAGRLRGTAYVCSVHYVPIAGHKPGKQDDYVSSNGGIEVWLVPLPEAELLVPYYIVVPTPVGTASMITAKFDVETPGGRHAFVN